VGSFTPCAGVIWGKRKKGEKRGDEVAREKGGGRKMQRVNGGLGRRPSPSQIHEVQKETSEVEMIEQGTGMEGKEEMRGVKASCEKWV